MSGEWAREMIFDPNAKAGGLRRERAIVACTLWNPGSHLLMLLRRHVSVFVYVRHLGQRAYSCTSIYFTLFQSDTSSFALSRGDHSNSG